MPTGSPQLNSFGSSFCLARELLEKGEKAVVLLLACDKYIIHRFYFHLTFYFLLILVPR